MKYLSKNKQKRVRGPNRLYSTPAAIALYRGFVRPFMDAFTFSDIERTRWIEGIEKFFNIDSRRIVWCRAKESFYIPGPMWATTSQPYNKIPGVGRRYVNVGAALYVRQDTERPDFNEVEFDNQVFVLTDAQLRVVEEKLEPIV